MKIMFCPKKYSLKSNRKHQNLVTYSQKLGQVLGSEAERKIGVKPACLLTRKKVIEKCYSFYEFSSASYHSVKKKIEFTRHLNILFHSKHYLVVIKKCCYISKKDIFIFKCYIGKPIILNSVTGSGFISLH